MSCGTKIYCMNIVTVGYNTDDSQCVSRCHEWISAQYTYVQCFVALYNIWLLTHLINNTLFIHGF